MVCLDQMRLNGLEKTLNEQDCKYISPVKKTTIIFCEELQNDGVQEEPLRFHMIFFVRLFIKNMVCPRCIQAVQQAAEFCEIKIRRISPGELETEQEHINTGQLEKLYQVLINFRSISTIKLTM